MYFPPPYNLVSRDRFGCPVPRQSALILQTQTESGAYSRDFSRFPRRLRPHILPIAIGSAPRLSGHHANACQWRSLSRVHWQRSWTPSSPQGSSSNGCCFFRFPHGPFLYALCFSHTHYWYVVGMSRVIQKVCVKSEGDTTRELHRTSRAI